jgi:hypothetical protein
LALPLLKGDFSMLRPLSFALTAILTSLTALAVCRADTGPIGTPPVEPPAPVVNGMPEADLVKTLREVDPNVRIVKRDDGGTNYFLKIQKDGWTFDVMIESLNGEIWINVSLGTVSDVKQVPAEMLVQLLESNFKIGPSHFVLIKSGTGYTLRLCRLVGRTTTAELFRGQIDLVLKQVRDSYPIWSAIVK